MGCVLCDGCRKPWWKCCEDGLLQGMDDVGFYLLAPCDLHEISFSDHWSAVINGFPIVWKDIYKGFDVDVAVV